MKRPPIGLKPKWLHDEQRLKDVRDAIVRYYNADMPIPIKWIEEYNELIKLIK